MICVENPVVRDELWSLSSVPREHIYEGVNDNNDDCPARKQRINITVYTQSLDEKNGNRLINQLEELSLKDNEFYFGGRNFAVDTDLPENIEWELNVVKIHGRCTEFVYGEVEDLLNEYGLYYIEA